MEELFFFLYHMKVSREEFYDLPIHERKWLIQRFIEQKNREQEAIKRERKGV